jgi:type II secretion system protein G
MPSDKKKKGFTLIELLVVVSIISLLSSIVLASLNSARSKARDAKRKEDIHSIQTALALYYNTNGYYPAVWGWAQSSDANWNTTQNFITALRPYIASLPVDPINNAVYNAGNGPDVWTTGYYSYAYYTGVGSPQDYDLVTQLENTSDSSTCQFKQWIQHASGVAGGSWCGTYSPYLYADH